MPLIATPKDNKEVYSTVVFGQWVARCDLLPDESFVIAKYLDPAARTLEAGTGAGRILFAMRKMGFTSLAGFDFVPDFVEVARKADPSGSIAFDVQDARNLTYEDASFDQVVYLQQILCLLDSPEARWQALGEAFRVLRPGGRAMFSFLSFDVRARSPGYAAYLAYLRVLRALRPGAPSIQWLPWLRLGGRPNLGCLLDRGPYVYWFRLREAAVWLESAGFRLLAIGTTRQTAEGRLHDSVEALEREPLEGTLYCVCVKPDEQAGLRRDHPPSGAALLGSTAAA